MTAELLAFRTWRHDSAERLEMASTLLGSILVTGGIHKSHVARVTDAAGVLMGLSRAVRADSLQPWPATTLTEIAGQVRLPLNDLRVVARGQGATTPSAQEDLSLVLGDLEELLREAEILLRVAKPAGAPFVAALGTNCGRGVS